MRNGETIRGTMFFALAALLLMVASAAAAAGRCSTAGVWIGENDLGLTFIISVTPIDNAHKRFLVHGGDANEPTGFGLFPTAVDGTDFQGVMERTGRYTFDQTSLAYARDDVGWVGTFAVSGTWTLSQDCSTAEVIWYGSAFFPEDDPIGGEPFFCFPPITGLYHRVPVVPSSCEE